MERRLRAQLGAMAKKIMLKLSTTSDPKITSRMMMYLEKALGGSEVAELCSKLMLPCPVTSVGNARLADVLAGFSKPSSLASQPDSSGWGGSSHTDWQDLERSPPSPARPALGQAEAGGQGAGGGEGEGGWMNEGGKWVWVASPPPGYRAVSLSFSLSLSLSLSLCVCVCVCVCVLPSATPTLLPACPLRGGSCELARGECMRMHMHVCTCMCLPANPPRKHTHTPQALAACHRSPCRSCPRKLRRCLPRPPRRSLRRAGGSKARSSARTCQDGRCACCKMPPPCTPPQRRKMRLDPRPRPVWQRCGKRWSGRNQTRTVAGTGVGGWREGGALLAAGIKATSRARATGRRMLSSCWRAR